MTDRVVVYGASDDLIELDGSIREEFSAYNEDDGAVLAFSDGTVLRVRYDKEGMWRIERIVVGSAQYEHSPATDPEDDYSDKAILTGDLAWCVKGSAIARRGKLSKVLTHGVEL